MTTLAWDGRSLAADRQSSNDGACTGHVVKIRRLPDGRLAGAAGSATRCLAYLNWLVDPSQPRLAWQDNAETSVDALEVLLDGTVMVHQEYGAFPLECRYAALGTGAAYALAAMECGRTASEAVAIAALFDVWTGGGADVLALIPDAEPAA